MKLDKEYYVQKNMLDRQRDLDRIDIREFNIQMDKLNKLYGVKA